MSDEKVVTFKFYEVQDSHSKIIVVTDDMGGKSLKVPPASTYYAVLFF